MQQPTDVVMGTWHLGGGPWGAVDEDEARRLLRSALDLGVTWFDTARAYGESEALLGRALRKELRHDRSAVVIASKTGHRPSDGGSVRDSSPERLRQDLETSLQTLGTDHLDVLQLHWTDPTVPLGEVAGTFADFLAEGKIRGVGLCNVTGEELDEFRAVCSVATLQLPYSMTRRVIERTTLARAHELDIPVMCYGALAHGVLTSDTVRAGGFSAGDFRLGRPGLDHLDDDFFDALARLDAAAAERGWTLAQLAVAFCVRPGAADSVIVGAHTVEEIREARDVIARRNELGDLLALVEALALPEAGLLPQFTDGKPVPALIAAETPTHDPAPQEGTNR